MRDKRIYTAVAGTAAIGVLLGSLLPWVRLTATFGQFSRTGLQDEGDGIITLVLGLLLVWAVAYYLFGQGQGLYRAALMTAVGGAVIVVAAVDLLDVQDRAGGILGEYEQLASQADGAAPIELAAAEGLYLVLLSGIAVLLTGIAALSMPPIAAEGEPEVFEAPFEPGQHDAGALSEPETPVQETPVIDEEPVRHAEPPELEPGDEDADQPSSSV